MYQFVLVEHHTWEQPSFSFLSNFLTLQVYNLTLVSVWYRLSETPQAQPRCLRDVATTLLRLQRKQLSARPAHGLVLAFTCTTRMRFHREDNSFQATSVGREFGILRVLEENFQTKPWRVLCQACKLFFCYGLWCCRLRLAEFILLEIKQKEHERCCSSLHCCISCLMLVY
jgi:hypothetical protein